MPALDWSWASTSNLALCPGRVRCELQKMTNNRGFTWGGWNRCFLKLHVLLHAFFAGGIQLCRPHPRRDSKIAFTCLGKMELFLGARLCLKIRYPSHCKREDAFLIAWNIVQLEARSVSEAGFPEGLITAGTTPFLFPCCTTCSPTPRPHTHLSSQWMGICKALEGITTSTLDYNASP